MNDNRFKTSNVNQTSGLNNQKQTSHKQKYTLVVINKKDKDNQKTRKKPQTKELGKMTSKIKWKSSKTFEFPYKSFHSVR
jgi:hypothetical protein